MVVAKKQYVFEPDYAVPPGETLKEVIESLDMSQKDLSVRTGLAVQSINRIFKGEQPVTYETANRLELATGVPAKMWNNLEALYREQETKIAERKRLEDHLDWLKSIPTRELIRRGAIEDESDRVLLLRKVLKFYGVSSVDAWHELWESPRVAARRSSCFESRPGPASAWLRLGEIKAHQVDCAAYDKTIFMNALHAIRSLTCASPDKFQGEMKRLCAEAGVAVVLVREMRQVPWHGASEWLSPDKAMVLLALRGKTEDQFWFSFFHEAGHILHDSKKDVFINDGSAKSPQEQKANRFAADFLIPRQYLQDLLNITTAMHVKQLARTLGISAGIVVGRYQHETQRWNRFNHLKRKFEWALEA